MKPMKYAPRLRGMIPQAARERLYEWSPTRAKRRREFPGVEGVSAPHTAVLTFDDGPDEDATPAVLDALDLAGVHATFFLLGSQLEANPELGRELVARGHEVGLHGYGHPRHDRVSAQESRDDLLRGFEVIESVLGLRCTWFRPPYGKMSTAAADVCRGLGMGTAYWSAWGLDWERVSPQRIAEVACGQLDEGGILLLHDSARQARRPSAAPTAQAIPIIAELMAERGLTFTPLTRALAREAEV